MRNQTITTRQVLADATDEEAEDAWALAKILLLVEDTYKQNISTQIAAVGQALSMLIDRAEPGEARLRRLVVVLNALIGSYFERADLKDEAK